jgi:signal transduction histidine kinase
MQTRSSRHHQATASGTTLSRSKSSLARAKTIGRLDEPAIDGLKRERPSTFALLDARELAQQVCERVRDRAEAKDVDVVLHCACSRVWVQPNAFQEALYELLANALQVTRRGYPAIIDVRETGDGGVLWQIQDSGEGMPERAPAESGRLPHPAELGGRGLGVAFSRAVVEGHGGTLRFESAPGVGTTASIWLPGKR